MLIQKISIDGFKNIANTSIEFNTITALVGLNNYGKSNFLEAIDFAQTYIKCSPKARMGMMANEKLVPINKFTANKNFKFNIEYTTELKEKKVWVNYEFSFEWIKEEDKGQRIVSEILKIKEDGKGKKYNNYITRDTIKKVFKSSETARCDKSIKIEDNELIINKLSFLDDLFYGEILKQITQIELDLNVFLDSGNAFELFPFEKKEEGLFELDMNTGNNIEKVVNNLKKYDSNRYELLVNTFLSLFPNITSLETYEFDLSNRFHIEGEFNEEIPFRIVDKVYRIKVQEKYNNQVTLFENLSNGTKRVFLLLTSAILSDIRKTPLIAFEELENCIHPYLFQQLVMILSELATNCRIIITSHSPYLIQYLNLEDIYIGVPSEYGVAMFKKIKKTAYKSIYREAQEEQISIGDYIFELLIDSYLDEEQLQSLIED